MEYFSFAVTPIFPIACLAVLGTSVFISSDHYHQTIFEISIDGCFLKFGSPMALVYVGIPRLLGSLVDVVLDLYLPCTLVVSISRSEC
jgi:hypothetical protein